MLKDNNETHFSTKALHPKQLHVWQSEWLILHENIEHYERLAYILKWLTGALFVLSIIAALPTLLLTALLLVLWLQEGIWKTFQSRLVARILVVEQKISSTVQDVMSEPTELNEQNTIELASPQLVENPTNETTRPFQLYRQFESKRSSSIQTVGEYVKNSLRPTVAFFYVALIVVNFLTFIF